MNVMSIDRSLTCGAKRAEHKIVTRLSDYFVTVDNGHKALMPVVTGYTVTTDGGGTYTWVRSIREVTALFNQAGHTISASTVHAIQAQRDDCEAGRPNSRTIASLPSWAQFHAVGKRGEREQRSQLPDIHQG